MQCLHGPPCGTAAAWLVYRWQRQFIHVWKIFSHHAVCYKMSNTTVNIQNHHNNYSPIEVNNYITPLLLLSPFFALQRIFNIDRLLHELYKIIHQHPWRTQQDATDCQHIYRPKRAISNSSWCIATDTPMTCRWPFSPELQSKTRRRYPSEKTGPNSARCETHASKYRKAER